MKKRRLKREWVFVLGFLSALLFLSFINYATKNYDEYLQQCDIKKGYTCNIFGQ